MALTETASGIQSQMLVNLVIRITVEGIVWIREPADFPGENDQSGFRAAHGNIGWRLPVRHYARCTMFHGDCSGYPPGFGATANAS